METAIWGFSSFLKRLHSLRIGLPKGPVLTFVHSAGAAMLKRSMRYTVCGMGANQETGRKRRFKFSYPSVSSLLHNGSYQ